jgi:hypothetical protein
MAVKVEYYRTARSDSLVTAVWDDVSRMWSVQLLLPEAIRRLSPDLQLSKRAGFEQVGTRQPKYTAHKGVQVGTSGRRVLFRNGRFHAEYWPEQAENGVAWGGTLMLWGGHLGQLFRLLRKFLQEPIEVIREAETDEWLRLMILPVSYIRRPAPGPGQKLARDQTLVNRVAAIASEGMLAWNVRLALYRMRGQGQPVGDQFSVDQVTGSYRYTFFNRGLWGVFSEEPVAVVPRLSVLRRVSNRTHHTDSGAHYTSSRINEDERASRLFAQDWRNSSDVVEFLVLGQIAPQDLIFMVRHRTFGGFKTDEIRAICEQHGMEVHVGDMGSIYQQLRQQILGR